MSIRLEEIIKIDDIAQTAEMSIYLSLIWKEDRIVFRNGTDCEIDLRINLNSVNHHFSIPVSFLVALDQVKNFWIPDLEVYYVESFKMETTINDKIGGMHFTSFHTSYNFNT